ncbi:MAG: MnmC family methyltransferase [Proteobacteria bacterium]|nr:MnmC family methyltransferase [Pseudomonadota bacterium]
MREIRAALDAGTFAALYAERRTTLGERDLDNPSVQPTPKPRRARTRGDYEVHASPLGFASIRHASSGEIMHATNDPDREAEALYVEQSALRRAGRPLVVWDVGLGAAHNAMAMIRSATSATAPVTLISFERDLDPFLLALAHQKEFPHLRHEAPHRFAVARRFASPTVDWSLVLGDFRDNFAAAPTPDVVMFDPFSSETNPELWSLALFTAMRARFERSVELFTYTRSTAIRSSLLGAGFTVARGAAAGMKPETTIALHGDDPSFTAHVRLDRAWLERRARSTARYAADIVDRDDLDRRIERHPQFADPLTGADAAR